MPLQNARFQPPKPSFFGACPLEVIPSFGKILELRLDSSSWACEAHVLKLWCSISGNYFMVGNEAPLQRVFCSHSMGSEYPGEP